MADNDRAVAHRRTEGFCKLMTVRGRAVGATLVGAGAGEQAALWVLAIGRRLPLSAVAGMVAPYPTLSELSKRAAGAYYSPQLFDNPWVGRVVRVVQRILP
jgi:pyruvate/2-oxoglutarate dehydrogenase complex dihydrolipoamide dehydrogenase (E3) component